VPSRGTFEQGRKTVTREHKLALIIGFSLVLILGILVSDHFSKARTTQTAQASATALTPGQVGGSDPLATQTGAFSQRPTRDNGPGSPGLPAPMPIAGEAANAGLQVALNPANSPRAMLPKPENSLSHTRVEPIAGTGTPIEPAASAPPTTTSPGLPVSREAVRRHDVQDGDRIYGLAVRFYNDGNLWTKIRDYPANKGKISADGGIREGVTLIMPPKDVLLGNAVLASDRLDAAAPGPRGVAPSVVMGMGPGTPRDEPRVETSTRTYTVQSGDTLADIARRRLGSARRAAELIELNKLDDPDRLKVGMTLKLPAR
jgi:nucleoid-associated protein YgaU